MDFVCVREGLHGRNEGKRRVVTYSARVGYDFNAARVD